MELGLFVLSSVLLFGNVLGVTKLQEQFRWQQLDYEYPNEQARINALRTGRFIPENNLPVGIEIWNDKLFVTVPRWRAGIPATLNYIPLNDATPISPRLIPYPDWQSNELGNCERGLSTVYRIHADKCDRLWVLDTGTFGIGNTTTNPCPYALNVFDLRSNRRIRRYELRKEDINANTFIANIAVDIGFSCDDTTAYLSDELGYGLIVYSWAENRSWRFTHGFFLPDPLVGDFNIGGLNFQWFEEGIFGMSLSPIQNDGFRRLFFSPIASNREFTVSTEILRNSSKVDDSYADFTALEERAPLSHTTSRVMDEFGVQFFNLIDRNAVGCWNMQNPYHRAFHGVVDSDDVAMIFPADVKVDSHRNLWVITDRMPNFLIATLNPRDINFRIFFAPVEVLIKDTVCDVKGNDYGYQQGNVFDNSLQNVFLPQNNNFRGQQIPQTPLNIVPQNNYNGIPQNNFIPINQNSLPPDNVQQNNFVPINQNSLPPVNVQSQNYQQQLAPVTVPQQTYQIEEFPEQLQANPIKYRPQQLNAQRFSLPQSYQQVLGAIQNQQQPSNIQQNSNNNFAFQRRLF